MRKSKCNVCKKEGYDFTTINGKKYCKEHLEEFMNKKIKCEICGTSIIRKEAISLLEYTEKKANKWFCCESCKKKFLNEQKYKDILNEEIMNYFGYETSKDVPVGIYVQLNNFIKKYKMTYEGMYLTLKYCIRNKIHLEKGNLGLLQWKYELAKDEYIKSLEIEKSVENVDITKTKTIYYSYTKQNNEERRRQRIKKILYLD